MKKRVIITAGGTGGHLFPAQATGDQLLQRRAELLFVGGKLSISRYFDQKKYPYKEISAATFSLRSPWKALVAMSTILRGFLQSRKIMAEFKPDVVVGFGSFFTLPLLLAALSKKIPIILHEQNSLPGKVNRLFSRFALKTAITFPETSRFLHGTVVPVDFPLRWTARFENKDEAYAYFQLTPGKKTLLIFGGSQGAKELNRLFLEVAKLLSQEIQVLHFTGDKEIAEKVSLIYQNLGLNFCVKEFESRMDLAWAITDLALTRAGASTIAELIEWEVPAILIPFPFATNRHQEHNGEHFVSCVKGGMMLLEHLTEPKEIKEKIDILLHQEWKVRKENIKNYKNERNYPKLYEVVLK